MWAAIQFAMASITAAGLAQTCSQFVRNDEGSSCAKIFADGFFEGDLIGVSKSLTTAGVSIAAGFAVVIGWGLLVGLLVMSWKDSSEQWWTSV